MDQQSDDHNNQPEKPSNDDGSSGVSSARSYDCTFCKRGFTNAQALGGHMNIHRKDKAKAKKKNQEDQFSSSTLFPQIAAASYNQDTIDRGGRHVNYQVYMPTPNLGPDKLQDGNLSASTGIAEEDKDDKVDLELRLGRLL